MGERHRFVEQDAGRATAHHQDPVGQESGLADRVRDEHDRLGGPLHEVHQQLVHLVARDGVERAERLIHQQDLRVVDQRAADGDALAHASGKLAGLVVFEAAEPDHGEQLQRPIPVLAHRPTQDAHREEYVFERDRVESVSGSLRESWISSKLRERAGRRG